MTVQGHHQVAHLIRRAQHTAGADAAHAIIIYQVAGGYVDVGRFQHAPDIGQGDVVALHALEIEVDVDLARAPAVYKGD